MEEAVNQNKRHLSKIAEQTDKLKDALEKYKKIQSELARL